MRILSTGGVPESTAAMKAGVIDAMPTSIFILLELELKREVRKLLAVDDYLPSEWTEAALFAEKDFAIKNPEVVREATKAIVKALDFIQNNPRQTVDKMKSESGFSEEAAKSAYNLLRFTKGGKLDRKALENVMNFLIEYGLIKREKAITLDEVYTTRFLP